MRLPDGNLQGLTLFTPSTGYPNLVAAVDGLIYTSQSPFTEYTLLTGVAFSNIAKVVQFTECLQSTDYDEEGAITFLESPVKVLVMQDGLSRAGMWNGTTARQLNPTRSNALDGGTVEGLDETPIGLWSVWSNNRLWVSIDNKILASDIGNPLKFTETQYINEARAFYLPSKCTGLVETTDQNGILVFTENEGIFIRSSIQNRYEWLSTPEFQKTILPKVGCVAPKSIVTQYGFIWWMSGSGLMSLDNAMRLNVTSRMVSQDNEMMASKFGVGSDLSGVCGVSHENFLLMSVPFGDTYNAHTWALDQDPFSKADTNSWAGFWTGWRPVEWVNGRVLSEERTFFISKDYDGGNRIWEAFLPSFDDNGTPIECWVHTKDYTFGSGDRKKFQYAEFYLQEVYGPVELGAWVTGQRGAFQKIYEQRLVASQGQVFYGVDYGGEELDNLLAGNRPQFRTVKTGELDTPTECNACGVESDIPTTIDRAFSLLIVWHGRLAINGIRLFAYTEPENYGGGCAQDEVEPRTLSFSGCGSSSEYHVDGSPLPVQTATATECVVTDGNDGACATATVRTVLSQEAAGRLAVIAAREKASWQIVQGG
jgi:hypothetical protein